MQTDLSCLTRDNLSKSLSITSDKLINFTKSPKKFYYKKSKRKKNGGTRILEIPIHSLKLVQKYLLKKILYKLPISPMLFGGPGSSTKKAVISHTQKATVTAMDINNFYPSIKSYHIRNVFLQHKATKEIAEILTRLVTYKNHLPQGAPTSTYVGLLVLQSAAQQIEKMLKKIPRSSFSIYIDDIIISGPEGIKRFVPMIRKILKRYRFEINDKTNIMNRDREQVCLNIGLNNGIEPPKSYLQELKELARKVPASDPRLRRKKAYIDFLLNN